MSCPAVMNGYHNRPQIAPPFSADGFYITGDVFRRDGNGFHYFIGRTDDMFVSGGENIYPADVERMLERHPDVAQAAVVPLDDEIKGQKPVAFVVPKRGHAPSADDVKRFALANAPAYAHPRFVWFVDELPLASTNKLDRAVLRRLAQERAGMVANEMLNQSAHSTLKPEALTTGSQRVVSSAMNRSPSPSWNPRSARGGCTNSV